MMVANNQLSFTIPFILTASCCQLLKFCLSNANVGSLQLASQVAICMIFVKIDLQTTPFLLKIFVYIFVRVRPLVRVSYINSLILFLYTVALVQSFYLFTRQPRVASYILSLLSDLRVNVNEKGQVERNLKAKLNTSKYTYLYIFLASR